jgi:hypothetical protein
MSLLPTTGVRLPANFKTKLLTLRKESDETRKELGALVLAASNAEETWTDLKEILDLLFTSSGRFNDQFKLGLKMPETDDQPLSQANRLQYARRCLYSSAATMHLMSILLATYEGEASENEEVPRVRIPGYFDRQETKVESHTISEHLIQIQNMFGLDPEEDEPVVPEPIKINPDPSSAVVRHQKGRKF